MARCFNRSCFKLFAAYCASLFFKALFSTGRGCNLSPFARSMTCCRNGFREFCAAIFTERFTLAVFCTGWFLNCYPFARSMARCFNRSCFKLFAAYCASLLFKALFSTGRGCNLSPFARSVSCCRNFSCFCFTTITSPFFFTRLGTGWCFCLFPFSECMTSSRY